MKRTIAQKMLLIGLMLGVATVTRPAQAPQGYQLPLENSTKQRIVNGLIKIKKSDFNKFPIDLQNEFIAELLKINGNKVNHAFLHAARSNLLWAIQPLLDRGANINFSPQQPIGGYEATLEYTALMCATQSGHAAMVEALIAAGAHVNTSTGMCFSALILAVQNNDAAIVKILIAAGAHIDASGDNGFSAVILAAQKGHTETVRVLIAAGAHIDASGANGFSALMWAAQNGHTETVEALIAGQATVNAISTNHSTALMLAAGKGHSATVEALIALGADVNLANKNNETALIFAANGNHTATAMALIAHGAHVDFATKNGTTALEDIIAFGTVEIVQILVNAYSNQLKKILQEKYTAIRDIKPKKATGLIELTLPFDIAATEIAPRLKTQDLASLREANSHCRIYAQDAFNRRRNESIIELKQKMIQCINFTIDLVNVNITKRASYDEIRAMLGTLQHGPTITTMIQFLQNELKIAENLDISPFMSARIVSPQQPACALDADIAGPAAPGCAVVQARNAAARAQQDAVTPGYAVAAAQRYGQQKKK